MEWDTVGKMWVTPAACHGVGYYREDVDDTSVVATECDTIWNTWAPAACRVQELCESRGRRPGLSVAK